MPIQLATLDRPSAAIHLARLLALLRAVAHNLQLRWRLPVELVTALLLPAAQAWVHKKKASMRAKGYANVPADSKYTGRKRKTRF